MSYIKKLRARLDSGEVTAVELTKQYLAKIKDQDKSINSVITLCEAEALKEAENADAIISAGKQSLLTGIPILHKDLFCTKGIKTTAASKMLDNFVAPYDSTVTKNCKDQGMVTLGKLNMDEFAMGSTNEHSYYGAVSNPWDLDRVPGGSSGGSAAAVAAGFAPVSTGSDTGGSVRQPASFCGLTAMKPTYGSTSRFGMVAFASSFDQAGIFGHYAEDVAIMLDAISGECQYDSTCVGVKENHFTQDLEKDISGKVIGIDESLIKDLPAQIQEAVSKTLDNFKKLGAEIKSVKVPDLKEALSTYYIITPAEAAANLARYDGIRYGYRNPEARDLDELYRKSRTDGFGEEVKRRIMIGNYVLASSQYDSYYNKAQQLRKVMTDQINQIFEQVDVIFMPAAPSEAFKKGDKLDPVSAYLSDIYTIPANISGLPAIAFPIGFANDLPVGGQFMAKAFNDNVLTQMVTQYQNSYGIEEFILEQARI
ncbi:Asp-tRNA(Asn)/Glu-tRNA(Gln) amidotransferase subunit GatA [Francisella philomiragia]|uniref:Glutamyl-tRNA(Gln) amidotransferase subunit A n=1 Tax=Francisella philomiragia subsp. philomiragia (strain ATCC 25017 / CCUG 19701 / FSC 153 / O\|nr:Asp-tRNA(Asn)/Glu-tRNA(Gln) amidotransferase subunit GatA [Francisella philomiragia]B0TWN0.1 RecName: Full=Glutamyl-tRNA(Gln) amidotransferase subunit A; Short=Glu-ADT subunit A [Francisella philomiragia subsp. philomiragia ATCC 25017]AJI46712.1 aspartyl/glutamyl-tRNA(Asn/Gln) amidotransferase, A subunit [Francisella philomiragia]AJI48275.1 aspartyl/glutamyl-tRNA(Asn/Gln) amidotransferase, A subunit [Francisella philomiragia]MBK2021507.1 Asp-tRNA(Asn)/Glu-tRNA(Gln) amidotransferase subunit G